MPEGTCGSLFLSPWFLWASYPLPSVSGVSGMIGWASCNYHPISHNIFFPSRSFELELFCAVNILQFVFLALKLDGYGFWQYFLHIYSSIILYRIIFWSWEITFIPLWIVLCISLVGVLYTIIFAGILLRMPDVNADQRRSSTNSALGYSFLVVPLLVFLVLLTNKLDKTVKISYFAATSPLFLTFFTLIITSFGTRGGKLFKDLF